MELINSLSANFSRKRDENLNRYSETKILSLLKCTKICIYIDCLFIPIAIHYGKISLWFWFSFPMTIWLVTMCIFLFVPGMLDFLISLVIHVTLLSFKIRPFGVPTTMVDLHPLIEVDVSHFKNPYNVIAHYMYIATCLDDQTKYLSQLSHSKELFETLDTLFPEDIKSQILPYLFGDKQPSAQ